MKKENLSQVGFFDDSDSGEFASIEKASLLKVVHAAFSSSEKQSWEDLFLGYDELYAITFSSGIDFVSRIVSNFSQSTIIYGCEDVLSSDTAAIMAMQAAAVKNIVKHKSAVKMAERMEEGKLKLYVSRDTKSHEKIFLLKGEGKTRVITGSANMSASAFCGLQRENIVCFDDQGAYDYYKNLFDDFLSACSDDVSLKVINALLSDENYLDDHIEEIPIIRTVENKKMVILEEQGQSDDDVELVATIKGFESDLKTMLPKPKKESGKIVLTGDITRAFKRKYDEQHEIKKETQKALPKLHIDYSTYRIDFNGKQISLSPSGEQIRSDIECIKAYFDGFSRFNGNVEQNRKEYFRFLTWYFASAFMPYLRIVARKNKFDVTPFPVVGIIYGESNGGKTTFTRFLTKLMCGHSVPENRSNEFTARDIEALKRGREGVPIVIDDLTKAQYQNNSENVIKDDSWGIADGFVNYPAIVITTNQLSSLTADISKRVITCRIDARINDDDGAKNSKKINESMDSATTALFGEYSRRMLAEIESMTDLMKTDIDYFPDIFAASSNILCSIVEESIGMLLPYMQRLTYSDFYGDRAIGKTAIERILNAWENEPQQFKIDRKNNKLVYSIPENGNYHAIRHIYNELPPAVNAKLNQKTLVMNLDQAEILFERKFKKSIFHR